MAEFAIHPAQLAHLIGTPEAPHIVDVRRRQLFDEASRILPTARWRDHLEVALWGHEIPAGSGVVVYCAGGHHISQIAASTLRAMGLDARFLEGGVEAWMAAGHVSQWKAALPARSEIRPSRWVTRLRPKIDRIACPWLIRRFIDRDAQFYFVEPCEVLAAAREIGAIAYDIEGAEFTHEDEHCTFDTLLARFGLADAALAALAPIVRGADTARPDLAPEAAGLLAVSLGNSVVAGADDHVALALGFPVYDALLAWLRFARQETHNWLPRQV